MYICIDIHIYTHKSSVWTLIVQVTTKQKKKTLDDDDEQSTTIDHSCDERIQEQEEMEMRVPPSRDIATELLEKAAENKQEQQTTVDKDSEISVIEKIQENQQLQQQEHGEVSKQGSKKQQTTQKQVVGKSHLRAKIQELLEQEQKIVHLLTRVLPEEYGKPIDQLKKQHLRKSHALTQSPVNPSNDDDTSYGEDDDDDDDDDTKVNVTDLAMTMIERCKHLGSHHNKFLENLRSCLAEMEKPEESVVSALNDLGTSVLGFVNLYCAKELIAYCKHYSSVISGYHWVSLEHSAEENQEFNTRTQHGASSTGTIIGGSLLDRQNQSFCNLIQRIDSQMEQRGQTGLARSDTVQLSMLFHLPTRLMQIYTRKMIELLKLVQLHGPAEDLHMAVEKLQKITSDQYDLLDQCFQLEKVYSIKQKLHLPSLAEGLVGDDYQTKTPRFLRESQVYRVKFVKSPDENVNHQQRYDRVEKLVGPCDAYLFDNVFIISWIGSDTKRKRKLYYITEGMSVGQFSTTEVRNGFSLRQLSGDVKVFKCMNQREQQSWVEQFKTILNSKEQEQAQQQLQLQQTFEKQLQQQPGGMGKDIQFFFTVDLQTLYKNPEQWNRFQQPDEPHNIEYSTDEQTGTKSLKLATLEKLIEKLTATEVEPGFDQNSFVHAFMLTYRSFIEPEDLLNMLITRYNTPPPNPSISPDEFKRYLQRVLFPLRLRIITLLQLWLSKHGYDFRVPSLRELQQYHSKINPQQEIMQRQKLIHKMRNFIDEIGSRGFMTSASEQLKQALENCSKRDTFTELKKKCLSRQIKVLNGKQQQVLNIVLPKPRIPRKLLSALKGRKKSKAMQASIVEWPSLEIARQLTILEFMIFEQIQPRECMEQAWNRPDGKNRAPNIVEMIERTNRVVNYFSMEVLRFDKLKERAHALSKMIKVAAELRRMNNFNGCFEVVGALNSVAVHRLKQTWALVSPKLLEVWKDLEEFCHQKRNFRTMRQAVKSTAPPLLPYIGLMLTDLVFIDEGNKSVIDGKINFYKRQKMSAIIEELHIMQRIPYSFIPVPELQNKLSNMNVVSTEKLNDLSFKLEPRKKG